MTQVTPPPRSLNYMGPQVQVAAGAWRAGGTLFAGDGVVLPECCVKCGTTEGVVMRRKIFAWQPAWALLFFFVGGLIPLIIAVLLTQKKANLVFGLCPRHRTKRLVAIIIMTVGLLLSPCMVIFGFGQEVFWVAFAGLGLFFGALVYGALAVPVLKPIRITAQKLGRYKGASPLFLQRLPDGPVIS